MAAIAQRLGTIVAGTTTIGSITVFYHTTPSHTTRSLGWISQYDQPLAPPVMATQLDAGPVLGVVRNSGSLFARLTHDIAPGTGPIDGFAHEMRLSVWGYVKATASDAAGTLIERLWADHINAILVDPGLGTLVADTRPDGPMDTDDGLLEPLAAFSQTWVVMAG